MKVFLSVFLLFNLACVSSAQAERPVDMQFIYKSTLRVKSNIVKLIAGEKIKHPLGKSAYCKFVMEHEPRKEIKKVKYSHLFKEITSAEQIADIRSWVESLKALNERSWIEKLLSFQNTDCAEALVLWNAYDDKWYAPARQEKLAAKKALEEKLLSELPNHSSENLEAVLVSLDAKGALLSVPRHHIWSGRFQDDGHITDGMGIRFSYPIDQSDSETKAKFGKKNFVRGILNPLDYVITLPCHGFEGRETCTLTNVENKFVSLFTMKNSREFHKDGAPYRCLWNKTCGYRRSAEFDVKPTFDEDVQMWKIGDTGYYSGAPEFPDYYFICEKFSQDTPLDTIDRGICESSMHVGDGLYFQYSFARRMFWEHRKIHDAVQAKIESFIIPIQE